MDQSRDKGRDQDRDPAHYHGHDEDRNQDQDQGRGRGRNHGSDQGQDRNRDQEISRASRGRHCRSSLLSSPTSWPATSVATIAATFPPASAFRQSGCACALRSLRDSAPVTPPALPAGRPFLSVRLRMRTALIAGLGAGDAAAVPPGPLGPMSRPARMKSADLYVMLFLL